jgi:hypothetical protein
MQVRARPQRRARGKAFDGFFVSSARLTVSSNPTSAKNASAVPPSSARGTLEPWGRSRSRAGSNAPRSTATMPRPTISSKPPTSITVSATLTFVDSLMPRKFTRPSTTMNSNAPATTDKPLPPLSAARVPPLNASCVGATGERVPNCRAAVLAEVMPDEATPNATMNAQKGRLNALLA